MQQQTSPNLAEEKDSTSGQFLTFILDNEEYAIEILRVQGIQGWDRVTPIPNTPEYILGVINLRGSIVPILELRRRFELPSIDFGPTTVVIIVKILDNGNERTLGIVVDAVSEVYSLPLDEVRPPPEFSSEKLGVCERNRNGRRQDAYLARCRHPVRRRIFPPTKYPN